MMKEDFIKILTTFSPEEINELIMMKGKEKPHNAITFQKSYEEVKNELDRNTTKSRKAKR